jgi:translation elongation factor aEF-1 beta
MAGAAVKIKIMPSSVDASLDEIEKKATELIENSQGTNVKTERQPIAFGLNTIIISFAWDEGSNREELEQKLSEIENVNSAEIIDFRRAFG